MIGRRPILRPCGLTGALACACAILVVIHSGAAAEPIGVPSIVLQRAMWILTPEERETLERVARDAEADLVGLVARAQPGEGDGVPAFRRMAEILERVANELRESGKGPDHDAEFRVWNHDWPLTTGRLSDHDFAAARRLLARYERAGLWTAADEVVRGGRFLWPGERRPGEMSMSDRFVGVERLSAPRGLVRAAVSRMRLDAADGNAEGAAACLKRSLAVANGVEWSLLAIDAMVGTSCRVTAAREVIALAVDGTLSDGARRALAAVLDAPRAGPDIGLVQKAEALFGRGVTAQEILDRSRADWRDPRWGLESEDLLMARLVLEQVNRRQIDGRFEPGGEGGGAGSDAAAGLPRAALLASEWPFDRVTQVDRRVVEARARGEMWLRAARLVLAIEEFRARRGAYPGALAELVPEFIREVPADPIADRPFGYRPVKDDPHGRGYVLYSLWLDQADQGGRMGPDGPEIGFPDEDQGTDLVLNQPREPRSPVDRR